MSVIKRGTCEACGADIMAETGCCGDTVRTIYTCGCRLKNEEKDEE